MLIISLPDQGFHHFLFIKCFIIFFSFKGIITKVWSYLAAFSGSTSKNIGEGPNKQNPTVLTTVFPIKMKRPICYKQIDNFFSYISYKQSGLTLR